MAEETSARASSSRTIVPSTSVSPAPPNSSPTVTPNRPASAMAFQESCGNSSVSSQWDARGASSRSATSRASLRSADCSSVSGRNCTLREFTLDTQDTIRKGDAMELGWPTWIGVVAEDLEAQRRFYRDVLGFRERRAGDDYVHFEFDGKLFEVLRRDPSPQYQSARF